MILKTKKKTLIHSNVESNVVKTEMAAFHQKHIGGRVRIVDRRLPSDNPCY